MLHLAPWFAKLSIQSNVSRNYIDVTVVLIHVQNSSTESVDKLNVPPLPLGCFSVTQVLFLII